MRNVAAHITLNLNNRCMLQTLYFHYFFYESNRKTLSLKSQNIYIFKLQTDLYLTIRPNLLEINLLNFKVKNNFFILFIFIFTHNQLEINHSACRNKDCE